MVESGVVTKINDNFATVSFERHGECDKCGCCTVSNDCTRVEIAVENTLNVSVGDFVTVYMGKKGLYVAAALIYLVPLFLVGMGVFIGSLLSPLAQAILTTCGVIVGFGIALSIDFCVIRKSKRFVPRMKEILSGNPNNKNS